MKETIILTGERLKEFCEEVNICIDSDKLLVRINDTKVEYYNVKKDCFCELELEVVKKYLS